MAKEWLELTRMIQGKPITVERVRLVDSDIAIKVELVGIIEPLEEDTY